MANMNKLNVTMTFLDDYMPKRTIACLNYADRIQLYT